MNRGRAPEPSAEAAAPYSKIATARIGLAVPPRILSGKPTKRKRPRPTRAGQDAERPAPSSPGAPIDRGPHTPEANQAHRGGGAVLEGASGAPAPTPQPTPPIRSAPGVTPGR